MRIEVKGRNLQVSDDCRELIERRFAKIGKQVSEQALLSIELCTEPKTSSPDIQVAEATLYLKGTTLRARDGSRDMGHAIHLISDEMSRQVKRHLDKRRNRRGGRAAVPSPIVLPDAPEPEVEAS
jgi:putative sigma-54 modulation protein